MTTTTYQIQSLTTLGQWEDEPEGLFATEQDASDAMVDLIELGEDWTADTVRVVEVEVSGTLRDSDTDAVIGEATDEQVRASIAAGDEGHIRIDADGSVLYASKAGRRVYVEIADA